MDYDCQYLDEPEHPVVAQVREGVQGTEIKFSGIYGVEDLHQNEGLKEDSHLNNVGGLNITT